MGAIRQHKGREVEQYVFDHPDSVLVIDTVAKAVGWSRGSCSTAMGRMIDLYPNMERIRRGVYRWNSDLSVVDMKMETIVQPEIVDDMTIIVVASDGDVMLVKDSGSGKLYKLTPFSL